MSVVTLDGHIETTLNVMGGKPRIAGHRITVENVVIWHERLGKSAIAAATASVGAVSTGGSFRESMNSLFRRHSEIA